MQIKIFSDPASYQSAVIDHLLAHEAENNLPLGILSNLLAGEYQTHPPYLALVAERGIPLLVVICTPPFPVLFSYQAVQPSREVLASVLLDLKGNLQAGLTGISAESALAAELASIWKELTGVQARQKMASRIYKLERVIPVTGVPGWMRPARLEDRQLLLDWYTNFHREAVGGEPAPDQVEKQISRYLEADPHQRGMRIWEAEGAPVSMAGYAGPTPHGIRIGAVFTPIHQRRRGFASACTAALSQSLLDRGRQFCFLFADLLNPTSNHIYQQIGYEAVCDVEQYQFSDLRGKEPTP